MNRRSKNFSVPLGNNHLVSSTPIPGHEAALNFSWPSPLTTQHLRKDVQLSMKSSKEKIQQFHESREFTSQTGGSSSENLKAQNFTKLSVIDDTDEEDEEEEDEKEEMRTPLKDIKNHKPSLEQKRQPIKRQKLCVSYGNNKQRKEAVLENKDATKSGKETRKNLEPVLEITEECEYDIIKDQRQTPEKKQIEYSQRNKRKTLRSLEPLLEITEECEGQRESPTGKQNGYSQKNKNNTFEKEQNEDTVELDHEIPIKQKRNSVTVKSIDKVDKKSKENEEERILIAEGKLKNQSLRKISSGRLQQHTTNKCTDTVNVQHTASETELPAATADKRGRRVEKSKKLSQESESMERSSSGNEVHVSTGSRKRSLYSHEKASFTIIEVSVNRNSSRYRASNFPFLEEVDNIPKDGANVQEQNAGVRTRKNTKRAKQSPKTTKIVFPSKTAESTPTGKRKFNSVQEDTINVRRSKRTRVKPLAFWTGERLCYKAGPDACFEIVGIESACTAEPIYRQRHDTHEHIVLSIPLQNKRNPPLKTVEITKEGRKKEVECFSTLRPVPASKGFSKYRMLDSAVTEAGLIKLASSTKDKFQAASTHCVFFILKGHALVQIQNVTQEVKSGEAFQVPKGIPYSIENLTKKEMVLHYVVVK